MIALAPAHAVFTIRELAEEFDVTARTLRFYESKGLLRPTRRGQSRVYSANDRARLALILRGKRVGFSLDEIAEILNLEDLRACERDALTAAVSRFQNRIEALKLQRRDLDDALRDLEAGEAWLRSQLEGRQPSPDLRRRAAAFEALAKTWLYGGESAATS